MSKQLLTVIAALLLLTSHASADEKTKERLANGEIVISTATAKGSSTPKLKAMVVVPAAPDKVWPIIDQCAKYKETMLRIASSEELSRKGNKVRCKITVEMPFPLSNLTATTEATHTVQPGKLYKREWKLIEGDYKVNTGSWTLVPFDDAGTKTLVVYQVVADPSMPIPDGIKKAAQKKSIPELMEKLRKSVQ